MRKVSAIIALAMFSALLVAVQISSVDATETLIWSASVSSSGAPVTSPILKLGTQYRIVTKEIFWYNLPANLAADAMYYTDSPPNWNWINHFSLPDGHSFLQINGMDVNWGPFSNGDTGHTYSIYYIGTGAAITFKITDWMDGDYSNNYCHLPVFIYETAPPESGHSPGYWKHQFNAYFEGKGKAQETWADLELWTGMIDAYYGIDPPYFYGYPLPPVSSFDYDLDGTFEMSDAYEVFNHNAPHWLGLANWYNWASGSGPYY
jgi:hypothetical protein